MALPEWELLRGILCIMDLIMRDVEHLQLLLKLMECLFCFKRGGENELECLHWKGNAKSAEFALMF